MNEELALLPRYLSAHVQLAVGALACGVLVSVPLGVLCARIAWLERAVLGAAGIVQTIPALALLAVMVPALAALGLPSIGFLPAFLGLVLYSVLPILRNTVAGLAGLDPAVLEAARGVGMTPRQSLWRVELPLALPVIIAGVRTATVWTVGMATLATPVGATSLGNFIFSGLQTRNYHAILVGCVASALLALALDQLVHLVAWAREKRKPRLAWAAVVGVVAICALCTLLALRAARGAGAEPGSRAVVIGAKTFTEQYVLAEVLAARVAAVPGARSEIIASLGSTVAFDALVAERIDVYVDYSGTLWATVMKREPRGADRKAVLEGVTTWLRETHGITLVCALGFENTYALAMPRERAQALGVRRISDLTPHASRMTVGGDYELFARAEWRAVRDTYALRFADSRSMDPSLMYEAVGNKSVDLIGAYSTDGRIASSNLVVLEDDRHAIPPYDAVVLASRRLGRERPDVMKALGTLAGRIDAGTMRALNAAVDHEHRTPREVAQRVAP